jgi:hypothetical protein
MFRASGLIFGGTEGVESHFHILRALTRFRRYRGRRVPFSSFALPDSFSAVPRASGPVLMFCAPTLIFGGNEGVRSRFNVLRVFGGTEGVGSCFHFLLARTRFWWYRGRWVPFSCFARSDSFSAVSSASGPVLMSCAAALIFSGTEGVGSRLMSCSDSFSAVPRASVLFTCFELLD